MNTPATLGAGALGGVLLLAVVGFLADPESTRDGQIVFTRWEARVTDVLDPTLGGVTVVSCESTPAGLRVRGRVVTGPGVTPILVLPGDPEGAGISVASTFAEVTGRVEGGGPGDFLLTLPWAAASSHFAVADPESLSAGSHHVLHGPQSRCG